MYVVIAGGGDYGESLAKILVKEKNDVAVVEQDVKKAEELAEKVDALVIKGSATQIDILKEAGIEKADAVVAMTPDDETNLMICQLAKKLKVPRVVSRVNDSKNLQVFVGVADASIDTTSAATTAFINSISSGGKHVLASLGGGRAQFMGFPITEDSPVVGKRIEAIKIPTNANICAIDRNGEIIIPYEKTEIISGDVVFVISGTEFVRTVTKLLVGE